MVRCQLVYKGTPLRDRSARVGEVFAGDSDPTVTVEEKGELQVAAEQMSWLVNLYNQYPFYVGGGLVGLLFLVLYILGGE